MLQDKKIPKFVLPAIAIGLFIYVALRAYLIPLTHDEGTSFIRWNDYPLLDCFSIIDCWHTANLHLLNSFLAQLTTGLFGDSEFAFRLPNVLAYACYLFYSLKLVQRVSLNFWLTLAGFVLLNLNPYLIEFFAYSRGYGLALGAMMGSLFYLLVYLENQKSQFIAYSFFAAALSIFANFTFLNYYALLVAIFVLKLGLDYFNKTSSNNWKKSLLAPAIITVLLFGSLLKPIQFLKGAGEFLWGSSSLYDTFFILIRDSLYGQGYLGAINLQFFMGLCFLILFGAGIHSIILLRKNPKKIEYQIYCLVALMPILLLLGTIVQHYVFGSSYLTRRRALLLIPLFALPAFYALVQLFKAHRKLSFGLSIVIILFSLLHFSRTANLSNSREWYYDMQTKEMATYLKNKIPTDEKASLGVNWLFHPSSTYYIMTLPIPQLEKPPYQKNISDKADFDYYFIEVADTSKLHPSYVIEKDFGNNILMRRED